MLRHVGEFISGSVLAMAWILAGSGQAAAAPVVVGVWPAGLMETRIALDGPVDAAAASTLVGKAIRFDASVRNVSAWRSIHAPLPTVASGSVRVAGVSVVDSGRTIVLATDPHPREGLYSLGPLPASFCRGANPAVAHSETPDGVTVRYDLSGAYLSWDDGQEGVQPAWAGWWPGLMFDQTRTFPVGPPAARPFETLLKAPGRLHWNAQLVLPVGRTTVVVGGDDALEATVAGEAAVAAGARLVSASVDSTGDPIDLAITFKTPIAGRQARVRGAFRRDGQSKDEPIDGDRLLVPWALPAPPPRAAAGPPPFAFKGGDRARGEASFYGDRAKCGACHAVRGRGGNVGPDLSDFVGRDLAQVFEAVAEPSATIVPGYLPYTVVVKDGRILSGIVRADGADGVRVIDNESKATIVRRDEVEEFRASGTSIMPVGLVGAVGEDGVRDLLAFLTVAPPR